MIANMDILVPTSDLQVTLWDGRIRSDEGHWDTTAGGELGLCTVWDESAQPWPRGCTGKCQNGATPLAACHMPSLPPPCTSHIIPQGSEHSSTSPALTPVPPGFSAGQSEAVTQGPTWNDAKKEAN